MVDCLPFYLLKVLNGVAECLHDDDKIRSDNDKVYFIINMELVIAIGQQDN